MARTEERDFAEDGVLIPLIRDAMKGGSYLMTTCSRRGNASQGRRDLVYGGRTRSAPAVRLPPRANSPNL